MLLKNPYLPFLKKIHTDINMKNNYQNKAWSMLTDSEKNSLNVTLGQGLSSWEAGEILGISHYKYLEVKERSEKFFKLFFDFFSCVDSVSLFPPNTTINHRFRDYIEACLEKRMVRLDAIRYSGDSSLIVTEVGNKLIISSMSRLQKSDSPHERELYKLIMEFDRWNNFRILPRSIQMPSAFKRRNNKRIKIYIKYLNNFPAEKANIMLELFWYNPVKQFKKRYWAAIVSEEAFEEGYKVISIKQDDNIVSTFTKFSIYVFNTQEHADMFGNLVSSFKEKTSHPRLGQKFWPTYQEVVERSINNKDINNINFYVEKLDMAYRGLVKPSKNTQGARRASSELFYK